MPYWLLLTLAIASEMFATSCLKASAGFTRLYPTVGMAAGYAVSFYALSVVVKHLPVGIVYATWSGLGTVGIALIGTYIFHESLPAPAWLGICMVVAGVVILSMVAPPTQ